LLPPIARLINSSISSDMNTPLAAAFCLTHKARGLGNFTLAQSVFVREASVSEDGSVRPVRDVSIVARDDDPFACRRVLVDVMAASMAQQDESGALQTP
jgi:hypothetical protein